MEEIFDAINKDEQRYIDFWCDMCKIESKSNDKAAVNRLVDFIAEFAEGEGFSVLRIPFANAGDYVVIDLNKDAEKGYLFLAHTDTVFEKGAFGEEVVQICDGMIYGPGVIDCKGGIAVALLVMKALAKTGYQKNLRLILTSDEEVDNCLSETGIDTIKRYAEGYEGAFCCEVGVKDEALVARKGILRYQVKVKGKAAHSGIDYFSGVNAIYEASKKIVKLQEFSRVDGPTYSCNIIHAGTAMNIVPEECSFYIDIRFKNYDEKEEAISVVNMVTGTDYIGGTSCELIKLSERDPMVFTDESMDLFEKTKAIADKYGLENLHSAESGGGSDAAYTVAVGVPTICGFGTTGNFCHTTKEYAEIESLSRRAKIIAGVIKCGVQN